MDLQGHDRAMPLFMDFATILVGGRGLRPKYETLTRMFAASLVRKRFLFAVSKAQLGTWGLAACGGKTNCDNKPGGLALTTAL